MMKTPSVSRRLVLRTGLAGLAGGVGAAALAACGETQVVTKEVPVQTTVIKEVPVEKIVRETEIREVPVEKIVTQQVDRIVTQTVEVEKVVEKIVERVVTQTVEKVVEIEKIIEVEKIVQAVAERAPGIDIHSLDTSVPVGLKPWDPKPGGEVSYMTFGNPTGFDPATWGGRSAEPAAVMFELLYTYGTNNLIYPHLASDLPEPSDDKLSWTIPLRNDVVFHDGEPFNADAAVFNFQRFLNPDIPRGHVVRDISSMSGVEKVDDFTIRLHTSQLQSPASFLHSIAHQHTGMASPKAITERGEAFSRDPIGTGPFKFNSWEDDVKILYDRFDDYNWGPSFLRHTGAPYPDRFRIQILGYNMTDNAQAFEANEVDICLNWSFADFKRVSENAKYHVIGFAAPGMGQYMPLHTQLWPLDDLNVRKALLFGVDRRTVTVRANGGIAPTNISNLLLPGTIGHSEEAGQLYTYDPAKGNQILDEAGYAKREDGFRYAADGRRLEITYPDRGGPGGRTLQAGRGEEPGHLRGHPEDGRGYAPRRRVEGALSHHLDWRGSAERRHYVRTVPHRLVRWRQPLVLVLRVRRNPEFRYPRREDRPAAGNGPRELRSVGADCPLERGRAVSDGKRRGDSVGRRVPAVADQSGQDRWRTLPGHRLPALLRAVLQHPGVTRLTMRQASGRHLAAGRLIAISRSGPI